MKPIQRFKVIQKKGHDFLNPICNTCPEIECLVSEKNYEIPDDLSFCIREGFKINKISTENEYSINHLTNIPHTTHTITCNITHHLLHHTQHTQHHIQHHMQHHLQHHTQHNITT